MYAIAARHAFGRQAFAVAVSSVWSSLYCKLSPSIRQFQEFTTDAFLQLGHSAMCRIKEIDIYFIQFTTILTDENSMHAHLTTINTTHTHTHTHNTSDLNASAFLCIHIRRRFTCRKLSFPAVLWRRLQQQMPDGICRTTSRITRERERERDYRMQLAMRGRMIGACRPFVRSLWKSIGRSPSSPAEAYPITSA